jgi:two-component SAPR family response regulator
MKALFMSGYTGDALERHGMGQSEINLLVKPFTPAALAQAVRRALDEGVPSTGQASAAQQDRR